MTVERTRSSAPGGLPRALARRAVEQVMWARVAAGRRNRAPRPWPLVPPTDVLRTAAERDAAVAECRRLGLPPHHDRAKCWDALGAVRTVLDLVPPNGAVLDAGAALYSPVLPWLRLYGFRRLIGINLDFRGERWRHGVRYRPGDITETDFIGGTFSAVTCMSVIEHGVPLEPFLAETARLLRPGGVLVVSTDYDQDPPDTAGLTAYGAPVHVFSPDEIRDLVAQAGEHGLLLRGHLALDHEERPVHWRRTGLRFTCIRLTFDRVREW